MRRLGAFIVTASLSIACMFAAPAAALSPEVIAPHDPPSTSLKVSAYDSELISIVTTTGIEYHERVRHIELHNDSNVPVNLKEYTLRLTDTQGVVLAAASFNTHVPRQKDYLPPNGFVTVSFNQSVDKVQYDFAADEVYHGSTKPLLNREFQLFRGDVGVYAKSVKLKIDNPEPQTRLIFTTVTAEEQAAERVKVYDTPLYEPVTEFPLAPIEVLANPKTCNSPTKPDMICQEYIKFYNSTNAEVIFDDVRLRIGSLGQNSTASNTTLLAGSIAPGEYRLFTVPITNSGGHIWLEDRYGVLPFENTIIEYPDASSSTRKGLSWANFGSGWAWAKPNPGGENTPLPPKPEPVTQAALKPCRADQYRSAATNRCKLIDTASSALKPCAANQVRSPETNRCRLSVSTASSSSLKPCAANQYRNPETGRCKLLVAAASSLKPCAPNQERNPATNRCRNVQSAGMPAADFPVDSSKETDNQSLGWMAFAGVGMMAMGYGAWEWRYEIGGVFRKLKGLVIKA